MTTPYRTVYIILHNMLQLFKFDEQGKDRWQYP